MTRTLLALAVASISFAALAGPPTDKPPIGPLDVSIVSPIPLPVTEVPSLTTPDRLFFTGSGGGIVSSATSKVPLTTGVAGVNIVLQSYDVQAHVATEATTTCTVNAEIYDASDEFVAALGRIVALPGRDAALTVELPNVFVAGDLGIYVELSIDAPADGLCFFDAQLRGVKVP